MTWTLPHALSLALLLAGPPVTGADIPTPEEARRTLAPPRGSLSYGMTSGGRLDHAVALPAAGNGWRFMPFTRKRGTHFGTAEMAGFIASTGERLRASAAGAVMGLGNISLEAGGKSPWHQSHQSGRDVDIAFFIQDVRGRSLNPTRLVAFDPDLRSRDGKGRWTFDVPRNLALVRAMLAASDSPVQWIFVADWLKRAMLDAAAHAGVPQDELERLELVMHQPSDSNPHDDHFHVRLFCSVQDRLHGCLERGPLHAWVDLGDEAFAERVAALSRVLRASSPRQRAAAAEKLGEIRASAAVGALLETLEDPERSVREASLVALRRVAAAEAVPGLLALLLRTTDPRWATRLFGVALAIPGAEAKDLALEFVARPERFLHPVLLEFGPTPFHSVAARVLGRYGRGEVVPALLALLSSTSADVRAEAETSLIEVTARRTAGSAASHRKARRDQAVAAWHEFWETHHAQPWPAWVRGSVELAGYHLKGHIMEPASLETLIEATGDEREYVSRNASRLLVEVTGHAVDPYAYTPRNKRRHWSRWWELNRSAWTSVAPLPRPPGQPEAGAAP